MDETFRADCFADATRRGFNLKLLAGPLDVGIAFAQASFSHLDNYSSQIFIAVWTGLLVHIDDCCELCIDGLKEFTIRFVCREPQKCRALDHLAEMTKELSDRWGAIAANIILAAEIDYIAASMIDPEIKGMEVRLTPDFPQFTREMSGVARAYSCQVFSPSLDVRKWIQVVPDCSYYIDHVNDLLSFYKEELAAESANFVSMHARAEGVSKIEALARLADSTAACYHRGIKLLQSRPEALNAFKSFCSGYIGFHALSPRYKLDQLNL
ncbi:Trichodiene synthase [Leucoagaricus sp. SymC.cos]|nr:Trichodiene synthase [Leucoagaricus sp. SymC.cos]